VFVTYLIPLVPGFLSHRLELIPRIVPVGLVVDKIALGQVFLPVLKLSALSFVSNQVSPAEGQ